MAALFAAAAGSPFVEDSPCSKLTSSCETCIANDACGWCDGLPTNNDGSKAPACLTLAEANTTWHCAGQLASAGSKFQCECDLPMLADPVLNSKSGALVNTTWRGFSIAPSGKWPAIAGELAIAFSNDVGTQGRASITAGNVTLAGNATMFKTNGPNAKLCPTDEILFEHDGGGNLSCSYAMNYQAGGASSYMAIGCNINGSMPALVDHKNYDMVRSRVPGPYTPCTTRLCDRVPPPPPPPPRPRTQGALEML